MIYFIEMRIYMTKKMEKKYIPLADFFQNTTQPNFTLTYEAIENIMGQQLPNAAYLNSSWWKKAKLHATHHLCWTEADYHVVDVKLGQSITFSKMNLENVANLDCSQQAYIIRQIETDDARNFINLQEVLFAECDFHYYGPGEQQLTVQQMKKVMTTWRKDKQATILLCILNGQFTGYLHIERHPSTRTKHIAEIRLAVKQEFTNKGIGTALLKQAELWAQKQKVERLEAVITPNNPAAIALFERASFQQDGVRTNALKYGDCYVDELYYSKLF